MAGSDTAKLVGGMGLLLMGRKASALALFGSGMASLEKKWRERHPEVPEGLEARWKAAQDFYEKTHKDRTNRVLHIAGIPLIVGGAAGLLLSTPFRPTWLGSAAAFAAGWALNIAGHAVFEKNAPAFTEDPLSFVAGPVWDVQQLLGKGPSAEAPARSETVSAATA